MGLQDASPSTLCPGIIVSCEGLRLVRNPSVGGVCDDRHLPGQNYAPDGVFLFLFLFLPSLPHPTRPTGTTPLEFLTSGAIWAGGGGWGINKFSLIHFDLFPLREKGVEGEVHQSNRKDQAGGVGWGCYGFQCTHMM